MNSQSSMASDFNAVTVGRNGRQLKFAFVDVSPDLAQSWLNLEHPENRKSAKATIADYSAMADVGMWNCLTGEALKFDTLGRLIDGGHRLRMVLAIGKTITMLVCWGCPPETFHLLDQGRSRTKLWWETREFRSTAQILVKFGNDACYQSTRSTRVALDDIVAKHRAAITFGCDALSARERGTCTAITRGVLARATYHARPDDLVEFADCLLSRRTASTDRRQFIVNKTLQFLLGEPVKNETTQVRYRKVERALQAFLRDEPITKLYAANGELFPLPEEQA